MDGYKSISLALCIVASSTIHSRNADLDPTLSAVEDLNYAIVALQNCSDEKSVLILIDTIIACQNAIANEGRTYSDGSDSDSTKLALQLVRSTLLSSMQPTTMPTQSVYQKTPGHVNAPKSNYHRTPTVVDTTQKNTNRGPSYVSRSGYTKAKPTATKKKISCVRNHTTSSPVTGSYKIIKKYEHPAPPARRKPTQRVPSLHYIPSGLGHGYEHLKDLGKLISSNTSTALRRKRGYGRLPLLKTSASPAA